MGAVFGTMWLIMGLAVPVAFVYFLVKGMWVQAVLTGVFLLAMGGTLWVVGGLKHG